jgi:hypothetical protein
MEIPKPPLSEITEDLFFESVRRKFEFDQRDPAWIEPVREIYSEGGFSLYEQARMIAFWVYNEIRIKQVFSYEFYPKLISENETELVETGDNLDQEKRLVELQEQKKLLKAGEFQFEHEIRRFLPKVYKSLGRNRLEGQSVEDAGKEGIRFNLALKNKIGIDLQPDKKIEESNHPYGEGNNF